MQPIALDKVLLALATPAKNGKLVPCKLTVVTCDLERNRGGERITYNKVVLASPGGNKKRYHDRNDTRRIRLLPSEEIRCIHPLNITHYNDHEVYI